MFHALFWTINNSFNMKKILQIWPTTDGGDDYDFSIQSGSPHFHIPFIYVGSKNSHTFDVDFQVNFAVRVSLEITSTELSSQCQTESVSSD